LDESNCYIIKEALEKFANNELSRIIDVAIFLDKRGVNI
jgi:hypothetical protein